VATIPAITCRLHRRALVIGVGTEHAAITGFGFYHGPATLAVIEELTGISRNRLYRAMAAFRAADCGFHNH
jgi:hypothetical protein